MIYVINYRKEGVGIILEGLLSEVDFQQILGSFKTCDEAREFILRYDYALVLTEDNKYEIKSSRDIQDDNIVLRSFARKEEAEEYAKRYACS